MAKKILVIDDDTVLVGLIEAFLEKGGFEVIKASSGREGMKALFLERPDLVLLDVVMPQMDGWQTCRRIREMCDAPIIFMTGWRKADKDVIRGLKYGADDYLIKPLNSNLLLAKVNAVLRRSERISEMANSVSDVYNDGFLLVDLFERQIHAGGKRVRLTPIEFALFVELFNNAGHIMTHRQLLEKVWGWEYIDDLDYVRIYIAHLRHKLEPEPACPRYIITELGVGYSFQKVLQPAGV